MGNGGYHGGSTVIGPRSAWFSESSKRGEEGKPDPVGESKFLSEVMGISSKADLKKCKAAAKAVRSDREQKAKEFRATLKSKRRASTQGRVQTGRFETTSK